MRQTGFYRFRIFQQKGCICPLIKWPSFLSKLWHTAFLLKYCMTFKCSMPMQLHVASNKRRLIFKAGKYVEVYWQTLIFTWATFSYLKGSRKCLTTGTGEVSTGGRPQASRGRDEWRHRSAPDLERREEKVVERSVTKIDEARDSRKTGLFLCQARQDKMDQRIFDFTTRWC